MADRPIAISRGIEVTPEMVKAGAEVLLESGYVESIATRPEDLEIVVSKILKSSLSVS